MSVKTESAYTAEFLVSEGNNSISREQVAIAANLALEPGTVVGKETATGDYKPLDPAAANGTETAAGVLYAGKTTDASGGNGVIIARLAEVVDSLLVWPAGITDEQKATAVGELAGLDIIIRNS
ncbi:head decoration protein [Endozoicomonas sp. SCSIO W0465]|uniref:head decoration protein n=1 Tax=Endozoicomonas sp. SCSIO W0465 TaxID=2918516 RepID=UPI00207540D4|nr:head decoration protein [Endozoicomonas sp. SCSIO W0465]USE38048.1 head decoration protein [Endozoicomonas sp. SCSIO W0465]